MFTMVKQFVKAKKSFIATKIKDAKIEATGSSRRRPTFSAAKVFATAKQKPSCNEEANKVQD